MARYYHKSVKLAVKGRQTNWAPVWAVIRKFGQGKKKHPSEITKNRRHWARTKLKIKQRKVRKRN